MLYSVGANCKGRRPKSLKRHDLSERPSRAPCATESRGSYRSRRLYTDGRVINREGERGSLELRAFWQDDALVVERTFDNGRQITQTYALSEDGQQLYVTIRIEGDRLPQPVEFRRVYDAA